MLFSSLTFLFSFLPCLLVLYFIVPKRFVKLKNMILLLFSLCFYAWGEPKYILLMLGTVLVSYLFGLAINYYAEKGQSKKKLIVFVISVITVLSSLVYFKYMNFLLENISLILPVNVTMSSIVLPIGISFYTFQILSYLIDLYRGKLQVQKNFFHLALYISFFPQLIAGPIVQYETIEDQLINRKESFDKVINGLERFIIGLGKKVIFANQTAVIADAIYNSQTLGNYSALVYIVGMLAYTFQIYFDFSGYSDMAIGLGKIFGFEFLENFNYPYIADSVTAFWRRWHISLTTFFREYLYIPLGGNRVSKIKWIRNMLVVWLLTGLWHGAAWNFILWGLYYFVLLYLEKTVLKEPLKKLPHAVKYVMTFVIVNIGWLLFRVNTLGDVGTVLSGILTNSGEVGLAGLCDENPAVIFALIFCITAPLFMTDLGHKIHQRYEGQVWYQLLRKGTLMGIFVICIMFLVSSTYNPFIYFRF